MNRRGPGSGGDPYGGSGIGSAVELLSDRQAWDDPQRIPSSPHNLPPQSQRVRQPGAPAIPDIRDPHHYARGIVNIAKALDTTGGIVLLESSQPRNMLAFRNTSSVAGEDIAISFGLAASASSFLYLTPGESVFFDVVVQQDDVYAVAISGTPTLAIMYALLG